MRLPPSIKPPSGSAAEKVFVSDDTGWRGGLAFAAARAIDPRIGAFQLTYANGTAPPGPDGDSYRGGVMRLPPGAHRVRMPNLDRLPAPVALRQMRSNLHVLDRAIGPGAVTGQQIRVVALDGRPIAGGWSSARLMSGSIEVADGINYPRDNGALSHFPDLTGGPHAACSAPG